MNDNKKVPNSVLRDYVSDSSFVLTLSRNHINVLVTIATNDRKHEHYRDFVNPGNGLLRRGLVGHVQHAKKSRIKQVLIGGRLNETRPWYRGSQDGELNCYWRLTKAGWLVFDLLVEAGMAPAIKHEQRNVA